MQAAIQEAVVPYLASCTSARDRTKPLGYHECRHEIRHTNLIPLAVVVTHIPNDILNQNYASAPLALSTRYLTHTLSLSLTLPVSLSVPLSLSLSLPLSISLFLSRALSLSLSLSQSLSLSLSLSFSLSFSLSVSFSLFLSDSLSLSRFLSHSLPLLKDRSEPRRIKETPGALVTIPPKKKGKKNRV